jgi:uncharacterized protein (TIGR02145 family)
MTLFRFIPFWLVFLFLLNQECKREELEPKGNSTVTDYDGNVYQTVQIGDQIWMAENLKVTHYADGSPIPYVSDQLEWNNLLASDKAYCWFDNSPANKNTYGGLYNWEAAMNGAGSSSTNPSGVQGVCPDGWHLPSSSEWNELINNLGGQDIAGGKLKVTGTTHWLSPNEASNSSGFSALGAGYRACGGDFGGFNWEALFWTTTNESCNLRHYNVEAAIDYLSECEGQSVRCLKD